MTFAEIVFFIAAGIGIYRLLRPLERWLEGSLLRMFSGRHPRSRRTMIDVTDFRSYPSEKREDYEHRP
jgi:hypothetical protein